jgi:predicted thioesterase
MKDWPMVPPGISREEYVKVLEEHSAEHLGSGDLRVLASPMMILFMEQAARRLLAEILPDGKSSVGSRVDVRHLRPSPIGSVVCVRAEVLAVDGRKIILQVDAWEGSQQIGTGRHWRYLIDEAQFMEQVAGGDGA